MELRVLNLITMTRHKKKELNSTVQGKELAEEGNYLSKQSCMKIYRILAGSGSQRIGYMAFLCFGCQCREKLHIYIIIVGMIGLHLKLMEKINLN